jgi:hypothetical protein
MRWRWKKRSAAMTPFKPLIRVRRRLGCHTALNPDEILTPLGRRTERSQEIVRNVSLRQRRASPGPLKTYGWKFRLQLG